MLRTTVASTRANSILSKIAFYFTHPGNQGQIVQTLLLIRVRYTRPNGAISLVYSKYTNLMPISIGISERTHKNAATKRISFEC